MLNYRHEAIRFWEKRRVVYNLVLIIPTLVVFFGYRAFVRELGLLQMRFPVVAEYLSFCAIGANICYSFAYAVEFFFGNDAHDSVWMKSGRSSVFIAGLVFSVLLAVVCSGYLASMVFGPLYVWEH